jgi:hypothetical protein
MAAFDPFLPLALDPLGEPKSVKFENARAGSSGLPWSSWQPNARLGPDLDAGAERQFQDFCSSLIRDRDPVA